MPTVQKGRITVCGAVTLVFFALVLIVGVAIAGDYGISWDEQHQRALGGMTYNFIFKKDMTLFQSISKSYGSFYQLILYFAEKIIYKTPVWQMQGVFYLRHLIYFLTFYIGIIFFNRYSAYAFKNGWIGLLGSVFLVLSPRVWAHAFYNCKDIPFMTMFIIAMYTLIRLLDSGKIIRVILHALACALLFDLRVIGIFMPMVTGVFLIAACIINRNDKKSVLIILRNIVIFTLVFAGLAILFWPLLWQNTIQNLMNAIRYASDVPYDWQTLYLGKYYAPKDVPWHYAFVWIFITTPEVYVILFIIGVIAWIAHLRKISSPGEQYFLRTGFLSMIYFFAPVAMAILMRSPQFDEWRHYLFIYPSMVAMMLWALVYISRMMREKFSGKTYKISSLAVALLVTINVAGVDAFMIKNHPYQNMYFNRFIGGLGGARELFDLDYWGLTYRKAYDHLAEKDKNPYIFVFVDTFAGKMNYHTLSNEDRYRFTIKNVVDEWFDKDDEFIEKWHPNYLMTTMRWQNKLYDKFPECWAIKVDGVKVLRILDLNRRAAEKNG